MSFIRPIGYWLLLLYYSSGVLFLPLGNFSLLPELPSLYSYCQQTQDADMMPWDFITDHLLCLDGLIDSHANGDAQKPHHFPPFRTDVSHAMLCIITPLAQWGVPAVGECVYGIYMPRLHPTSYTGKLLRPPQ